MTITKSWLIFGATIAASLSLQPAIAGSNGPPDTGNQWLSYCPSSEIRTRDWDVTVRQVWCAAYVRSFSNAIAMMRLGFPEIIKVCLPPRATAGQLNDLVKAWIIKNPADRHREIELLMFGALADSYPCQDSKTDKPTAGYRQLE